MTQLQRVPTPSVYYPDDLAQLPPKARKPAVELNLRIALNRRRHWHEEVKLLKAAGNTESGDFMRAVIRRRLWFEEVRRWRETRRSLRGIWIEQGGQDAL